MMKRIMIKTHQLEDKSRVLNSRDKCSIHESQELRGFGNESEAYRDRPSYKLGYATFYPPPRSLLSHLRLRLILCGAGWVPQLQSSTRFTRLLHQPNFANANLNFPWWDMVTTSLLWPARAVTKARITVLPPE